MKRGTVGLPTHVQARGYYTSLYMVLFMPMGIALWLVTGNPGMIGAGVAVGLAIGASVERASTDTLRSSTPEERSRRERLVVACFVLGACATVISFLALTLL